MADARPPVDSPGPKQSDESDGESPESFDCGRKHCDDGPYSDRKQLIEHVRENHPVTCAVCGAEYGTAKARNGHVKKAHDL